MINNFLFFLNIKRMSEKTLKFGKIIVNKREFNISKQPIDADQLVTSDRFKRSDGDFKYFIGYQDGETVKPLCIILPQMSGYIKYFESGAQNMSFMVKDDDVLDKYNDIWEKIKSK